LTRSQPADAGGRIKPCHYPHFFLLAPEAQQKLAGAAATGRPVIIALAPRQGSRTGARLELFRSLRSRPAPLPGREELAARTRWRRRRLISTALSGTKAANCEVPKMWVMTRLYSVACSAG
jgi:hypothetical protein